MSSFLTLQLQKLQLSGAGITSTVTTITLQSMKLIDGITNATTAMFGDIGYMTIEPGTSREEQISFTGITQNGDGTATLTGVVRGVGFESPYAETSAYKQTHAGSVTCVVSNTSAFYSQFVTKKNDETIVGIKTHTVFPVKSGTTTPTSADQLATKAYVDAVVAGTAVYDQNVIGAIAGEALVAGNWVYYKASDQRWWKGNGSTSATAINVKIGVAQGTASAGGAVNILIGGLDKTNTGMTAGSNYYLADVAGTITTSVGTVERFVGYAVTATTILLNTESVTADEKNALAGTSGISPSTNNKFIDNADTTVGATQTAITIAFVDSNPDTITDSASGFLTAGFKSGDSIAVTGSASNNSTFTIDTVVAGTITLIAGDTLVAEVAGASVTITADVTSKVVRLQADDKLPAIDGSNLINIPVPTFNYQVFTASGTWIKPAGVTSVKVTVVGGGAGGGGTTNNPNTIKAGYGGGAGGTAIAIVSVSGDVTVTVGSGGTSDTNGGSSIFAGGTTVTANGGSGVGGGTTINADVGIQGQYGENGAISTWYASSGLGGSSKYGGGGRGYKYTNGSGGAGTGYGSGGGGAFDNTTIVRAGGNGTSGLVIVEWSI